MREFQGKRQFRRWIYSRPVVGLLLLGTIWVGQSAWGVWQRSLGVATERGIVAVELTELETRERDLKTAISQLETERGMEAELRSKFSVAQPGERVISVIYSEATSTATTTPTWRDWLAGWFTF